MATTKHTSKRASKRTSKPTSQTEGETPAQPEVDPDQQPATLDDCRRCPLWANATQGVPGAGPRRAPIMMVGEQPGDKEDLQGLPFVGPAGALLDDALVEAGVGRKDVYVTNAVKHFKWTPRGKRRMHKTPAQREVDACRYWLDQELESVGAQVIIALGATALKAVLEDPKSRLQDAIGKVIEHGDRLVVATYHPSFALRAPDPETRHRAYAAIVAALQDAKKLAQRRK
ncbi:UdgX family uracil-DNA binding protein [Paraburkholderia phenoliruptrix]|uniref:UdgX family uracil-DNA binding protein n=1 Tax=Paraburkholderia phenoliruptrix TaxID=252970 RepID=UPI002869DB6B|nr:UdgX family uracil-DNA binding protein [Paraburkholderia phenoliruptrix]WMY12565.1 UdgX family uracil-DNA binding protein [Paraburkholderia phenoliruptrix]